MAEVDFYDIKDPGNDIIPVVPHDTNDIPLSRAITISVGGDIKVITKAGNTRLVTLPPGLFPLRVTRVFSTDTTATGISAVY